MDTFIVGGETAGIATACALSKTNFFTPSKDGKKRIILLNERQIPKLETYTNSSVQKKPDDKVATISFSTLQLLHSLGALEKMNHMLITPYRKMFVNDSFGKSHLVFDDEIIDSSLISQTQQEIFDKYVSNHSYQFVGKNSLGASVEYDHIQSALYEVLKEQNKCEIIDNDSIRYIRPAKSLEDMSTIELESGRRFTTKLIIGNDGENSYTREVHNIEATSHAYNQK